MLNFLRVFFAPKGQPWYDGSVYSNLMASALLSVTIIYSFYKMKLKCTSCWRPAHHKVEGTHYHTCHVHSTIADHKRLSKRHSKEYPAEHDLLN